MLNQAFWHADPWRFLGSLAARFGDMVGFDLGQTPVVLVNGPPLVRELLFGREDCLNKPEFVKQSNRGHWGDGLTTLEGEAWRARRRLLRPAFQAKPARPRLGTVAACTMDMLASWPTDGEVDLLREFRLLTARIAARQVLDADIEGIGTGQDCAGLLPFVEAFGETYQNADATAPIVITRPRAPRRMDAAIRLIDARICSGEDRGDILSALVRARLPDGAPLSRDDIIGEVLQFLYSGHLTIPAGLVTFWHDVASHGIGAHLAAEAASLRSGGLPDTTTLAASYVQAALKESMRLRAPAPILYREAVRDFELGGYLIAAATAVWVSPQVLHRDPRHYSDPDRFLPERFMPGSRLMTPGAPYLPFGLGARQCIALQPALQQMALIVMLLAAQLRFAPVGTGDDAPAAAVAAENVMFRVTTLL